MFVFLVNTPSRGSQLEEMEVVVVVLVLLVEVLVELVRTDNFITFQLRLTVRERRGWECVNKRGGGRWWGLIWNSLSESDDKVSGHITGLVRTWDARSPVSANQSPARSPGDLSPGQGRQGRL